MSRVLVISQLPPPIHGSTIMTRTFLQTLDALDQEWQLVDRRFSKSVTDVGRFSLRKVASAFWMPGRLLKAMWEFKPDTVVMFATNRTFSFVVDWALSEVLRCFPARRINYLHTVGFEALAARNRVFDRMTARLLGSANATVCLGPTLAKDVTRWLDASRVACVPNAVADRPENLDVCSPAPPPVVLYLSNLIPDKGADTFVDLALELAPEFPGVTFVVAGATADQSFTDSLIETVQAAGLSARVQFRGAITDSYEKWCLLRDASVLVFPSTYRFEAQPLTILEALSVGTPVLAYDVGGIHDVLSGGGGSLFAAHDHEALVASTRELLTKAHLREAMSHDAREAASNRFSIEAFRANWIELLTSKLVGPK